MLIVDADDFFEGNTSWELLTTLKSELPTFKITLFTIPGRCSKDFIREMASVDWIDMAVHGWMHKDCYESVAWKKADCKAALKASRELGISTRGFKAPGWQISDACYEALIEEGYWCGDQIYNCMRWPSGLSTYAIGANGALRNGAAITGSMPIHSHINHVGGHNANALEIIALQILAAAQRDTDFRFISEVME